VIIDHGIGDVYQQDNGYLTGIRSFLFSVTGISAVSEVPSDGSVKMVLRGAFTPKSVVRERVAKIVNSERVQKVVKKSH
jgi:uncharacterized membrane protein